MGGDMTNGERWFNTRVPDTDPDEKGYYSTRHPPLDGGDDDDETDDGEYECMACGHQTDIPNEHASQTRHWCDGNCNAIKPFTRIDD